MMQMWEATNSARVQLPFSAGTWDLLNDVRYGRVKAYGGIFTGVMVRALWRGAKEQTSRARPWPVKAGGLVYVREAHALIGADKMYTAIPQERMIYRANEETMTVGPWKPSIHMPRWGTRLLLRMTHDPYQKPIAEFDAEDVLREGCPIPSDDPEMPGASFDDVWQSINGERATESSAVVYVHRFEVLR